MYSDNGRCSCQNTTPQQGELLIYPTYCIWQAFFHLHIFIEYFSVAVYHKTSLYNKANFKTRTREQHEQIGHICIRNIPNINLYCYIQYVEAAVSMSRLLCVLQSYLFIFDSLQTLAYIELKNEGQVCLQEAHCFEQLVIIFCDKKQ